MRTRKLGKTRIHVTELTMGFWEIGGLFWGPIDQFVSRRSQTMHQNASPMSMLLYRFAPSYAIFSNACSRSVCFSTS